MLTDLIAFERLTPSVAWSETEVERLLSLRALGHGWPEIAAQLGRTESGVKSKFKYQLHARTCQQPAPEREPVPPSVLAEQARRVVAWGERSLTAALMGDPAPQYSSLARRAA